MTQRTVLLSINCSKFQRHFIRAIAIAVSGLMIGCATRPADKSSAMTGMTGDAGIPHLEKHGTATQLVVDGKPFLVLGGELHNSSASSVDAMKSVWPRLAKAHLNTVIASASWELIEPTEGQFDFSNIDGLVQDAEANHLHLVLLWFGSWKNGLSSYPPLWVKTDPARFPLAQNAKGETRDILSTFGEQTAAADAKAFAALMHHLRDTDIAHTVLAMQVENEVGVRDDSRDRCPAANAAFAGPVPQPLLNLLATGGDKVVPELHKRWQDAGSKSSGSWTQVFGDGPATDELFMAWHYARYVTQVAAAGKAENPIPMYANAWLNQKDVIDPGVYPSGGPLAHLLNVWQVGAPSIDFLSPDLYAGEFEYRCRMFTRAGNPLFIPETNTGDRAGANAIFAFGKYNAIGFSPFGIDGFPSTASGTDAPPMMDERLMSLSQSYAALQSIAPLILAAQGTNTMTAVLLGPGAEDSATTQPVLHLNGYTITMTPRRQRFRGMNSQPPSPTQAGLVIATGPDEFIVLTTGLEVSFSRDDTPGTTTVGSIDEGSIVDGKWVRGRRYNGDQTDHNRDPGRAMSPYRVLRIKLFQRP